MNVFASLNSFTGYHVAIRHAESTVSTKFIMFSMILCLILNFLLLGFHHQPVKCVISRGPVSISIWLLFRTPRSSHLSFREPHTLNHSPVSANRPPPDLASPSRSLTLFPSPSHSACTLPREGGEIGAFYPLNSNWIKSNGILHLLCLCLLQRQSCFYLIINPNKYFLFSSMGEEMRFVDLSYFSQSHRTVRGGVGWAMCADCLRPL